MVLDSSGVSSCLVSEETVKGDSIRVSVGAGLCPDCDGQIWPVFVAPHTHFALAAGCDALTSGSYNKDKFTRIVNFHH